MIQGQCIVALIYQEDAKVFASILGTMGILLFLGVLGTLFKPKNYHIYTKEGMLIVALCWVLWSFFGGLPFVFAGQIPKILRIIKPVEIATIAK